MVSFCNDPVEDRGSLGHRFYIENHSDSSSEINTLESSRFLPIRSRI